jgi:hypothetical protein
MLRPLLFRFVTTQSMAASTWLTSVAPDASATFTLTRRLSGATPTKFCSPPRTVVTPSSLPVMRPAMWVP